MSCSCLLGKEKGLEISSSPFTFSFIILSAFNCLAYILKVTFNMEKKYTKSKSTTHG